MRATIYPHTGGIITDFKARLSESRLADHLQPALLLLALPYMLVPRSETLGVVVSVTTALGALPLYKIAQRRLRSQHWALGFALGYLMLPAVETACGWDIHGTAFLLSLLLAAFDAAQRGKHGWWWLWTLLAMGCREDLPLLIGWAMLWMAPSHQRHHARAMACLGLIWSLLAFLVIIPHFGGGGTPYITRFFPPGTELSQGGILRSFRQPSFWKATLGHLVTYNVRLGLPLLFLFWLSPRALLAMAPFLLLNSLSWYEPARHPELSHYSLPIVPWALVGTVEGFHTLEHWLNRRRPLRWRGLIGEALAVSVIATHLVNGYTPLSPTFVWPARTGRELAIQAMLDQVPADVAVSAEMHLAAHLATRETLRLFPDTRDATWIVIDAWFGGDPYGSFTETWQHLSHDGAWETVDARNGVILLRRGQGPPQGIENAFQSSATLALRPLEAWFGRAEDGLQLHGLNLYCRAAGLCHICLRGTKSGTSFLKPLIGVSPRGDPAAYLSAMQGTRVAPRVYTLPGTIQDCAPVLIGRGLHPPALELTVVTGTGQRLPVRLLDTSSWGGHLAVKETALLISFNESE